MSDTLVVCITIVVVLGALLAAFFVRQRQVWAREDERSKRYHALESERISLAETINAQMALMGRSSDLMQDAVAALPERYKVEADRIHQSVMALAERQVVLESAIKNAIAEVVKVAGYEEAKYKALLAKTVTAPSHRR